MLIRKKMRFFRVIFFECRHECTGGADFHTAQAALAVIVVKPPVDHAVFFAVDAGSKLEDHIRACRVTQSAVDTFFRNKKGNVPFARGGQIVGDGASDPRIDAADRSVGIAPSIPFRRGVRQRGEVAVTLSHFDIFISQAQTREIGFDECGIFFPDHIVAERLGSFRAG